MNDYPPSAVDPSSNLMQISASCHANLLTLSQMVADLHYVICTFATITDWLTLRH
ncbi:hypothetical protein IQ272_17865 [Chroococcidiopsidales cyanobacterium LEGE 13417]|uniref:hypothetical protein n=1 Tax=Chroococcidiopsis sp. CCALA 051 TaxID=869949 RepID=UPI0013047C8F|nr:hypothetical protein [Chroococcidiopsis sp. CCALA 051]MBE9017977.1 hypothetical protein [Chroococcidiopsidales cyanobacterium LEGE 13417]